MQHGARFAAATRVVWLDARERELMVWVDGIGRALHDVALEVHDVAVANGRAAALYSTATRTCLVEVTLDEVAVTLQREVPAGMCRVALTDDGCFVASEAEVRVLAPRDAMPLPQVPSTDTALADAVHELIAFDAIDIAASPNALCVADQRGLSWFDAAGRHVCRQLVSAPSAVAYDPHADAWLLASDNDVLHLAHVNATPVVLARGVGVVSRVRRDREALYVMVDGELRELRGIERGPTSYTARTLAAYAPGFSHFDAHDSLYIDEGGGPSAPGAQPARSRSRRARRQ